MALATAPVMTTRGPWEWPKGTQLQTKEAVSAVLWALADSGGTIEDISGMCSSRLVKMITRRGWPFSPKVGMSNLLKSLSEGGTSPGLNGCIRRHSTAKRTYQIDLLLSPDEMPPRPTAVAEPQAEVPVVVIDESTGNGAVGSVPVVAVATERANEAVAGLGNGGPDPDYEPDRREEPESAPTPERDEGEPTTYTLPEPNDAMALLLQAANLITQATVAVATNQTTPVIVHAAPEPDEDRDALLKRLGAATEQVQVLTRRLRDVQSKATERDAALEAKVREVNGLKTVLANLQANNEAMRRTVAKLSAPREQALNNLRAVERTVAARPDPDILRRQEAVRG